MDIAEHVEACGHCVVQTHAAGRGHARGGDGRRLRAMIDGGDQCGLEQGGARAGDLLAHHQKPDHLGKAFRADQLLHRRAAQGDATRFHVDDAGAPPVGNLITQIAPSSAILRMSSSQ
jgi:hypothetical protein